LFATQIPLSILTWFNPVWYRKFKKNSYPVQILRSHRFISIPTCKMHPAGAIFEFAIYPKCYLHFNILLANPQHTTHNTQHRTTKMAHCRPTLQWLCPLSPWVGQRLPQILVLRLPMGPLQVPGTGFAHVMAGSLVWDEYLIHIKKYRDGGGRWP
jgi:hypothetical protein